MTRDRICPAHGRRHRVGETVRIPIPVWERLVREATGSVPRPVARSLSLPFTQLSTVVR